MAVTIAQVQPGSPAARRHIHAGEQLVSINGHLIEDVLDYRFYMLESRLELVLRGERGEHTVRLRKDEYEDPGLEFETYLMDKQRSCRNKCVFCFIDQLPPGMRESLYFKDDDSRLSFLFGNYITLTNLSEHEVERIITMHISPINISVHTTNPQLRCRMMGNRFAGDSLAVLRRLTQAGIDIQCQLVLCPGWNDGEELERSMQDIAALMPAVKSVAAVPVGLTRYREGLEALSLFTKEQAADVIDRMEAMGRQMLSRYGTRLFYPSDELYIIAERPIPDVNFFGELSQLENGVGMTALLRDQFAEALAACNEQPAGSRITIVTGVLAAPILQELVDEAQKKWHNLSVNIVAVKNRFFGETITVAGLVTGGDILEQLRGRTGDLVVFPDCMLRSEGDCFLDDKTPEQLAQELGVPVEAVPTGGEALVQVLLR